MSELENTLLFQIKALNLPKPVIEYKFHPTRRWRFDIAWPELMLAVEVEGGTWINGRHSRGSGMEADLEKYGEAMKLGWNVYRCSSGMIKSGKAVETIELLIGMKSALRPV
jgi:hypothetical protein